MSSEATSTPSAHEAVAEPALSSSVEAALKVLYRWDYGNEADAIRTLYLKGLDRQWTATRDLDWSWQIDPAILGNGLTVGGVLIHLTKFWGTRSDELRTGISLRSTGFTLSNFLQPRTIRRRP